MSDRNHIVMVNAQACNTGCVVDGHWGQYGPDHLADRASEVGWEPAEWHDDPRVIRKIIDNIEAWGYPRNSGDMSSEGVGIIASLWEAHTESADDIETWLNQNTAPNCTECGGPMYSTSDGFYRHIAHPSQAATEANPDGCQISATDTVQRFVWHWHDGEFFLSPICDDPDECEDETCAHWD